jgi:hypothetical protein
VQGQVLCGEAVILTVAALTAATLGGLHDARYCEVLEVKGAPPNAKVVVWNTVGLNDCPAAKWNSLDATQLAKERGDTAVVLNGPRHWVFDSVTGKAGQTHSFHGLRMRKVAAIRIRTAAELVQTPYTDRTIERSNTWHWNRGRVVYELVAPGGDVYVMQAYSQIKDRSLSLRKLRTLGRRIDPPPGWHYRVRRLRHKLDLVANGSATIIQDELQNTYQLARTTRPAGPRKRHRIDLDAKTKEVGVSAEGIHDQGKVSGTPFGKGTIDILVQLNGGKATGTFRLTFAKGSVSGTVDLPFTITGGEIDFSGTAQITGGTGAYRGITSGKLQARDHNTLDGQNGVVTVAGFAKY